ncbi:outer membrane protein assembly factor BamA [Pseudooceanicola sp.]|uniref:outer membrane protein assembly factor BamA n=1 Tax=Pseudooceanicola sp. TaxID=1914328 RepID=UPI0026378665|nr:outer membrane protein assembly factor BamA [Pseudooceanicola sp.]
MSGLLDRAEAQSYRFSQVSVSGNERIETGTIVKYASIPRGKTVTAADLNAAYQRIVNSGLFEKVDLTPRGSTLVISVIEFPTVNRVNFEGNRRIKDEVLSAAIGSKSRYVLRPNQVEADAQAIAEAYAEAGRVAARVTPRIIRLGGNRVNLVFEIFEGKITELERVSFVGNKVFSDYRLRRVIDSKQAGAFRLLILKDTYSEERVAADRQTLRDFYLSRGYVDFRVNAVKAELARERDGYFLTFNIVEGQQFKFGKITTSSEIPDANAPEFQDALKIRPGLVYSPVLVENSIARMERLAIRKGIDFLRVEPRITRNERDLTLDIEFVLTRGPRVFVERIDVEGNTTTLDSVVRRQFKVAEGDPFNPREIRESAARIRALGYFANAEVNAREGTSSSQVVVDVNVEEKPTGSLSFGGTYSTSIGFGLAANFKEDNFLGRGQRVALSFSGAESNRIYSLNFTEPAFLGRDVAFDFGLGYVETDNEYAAYDTATASFGLGLTFPLSESINLKTSYNLKWVEIRGLGTTGGIIAAEGARGGEITSSLGYLFTFDSRSTGLNPNAGVLLSFGQDFAGAGGDARYVQTSAKAIAQTKVFHEEITLRATLQGGALTTYGGYGTRVTDRYLIGSTVMRGFQPDGVGPREIDTATNGGTINDALGGKFFAVAQFEAEFPLGLPSEYGIRGGLFYDVGTVWGLDGGSNASAGDTVVNNNAALRHVLGLSVFWDTPIGPLRFNWSKAIKKESFDREQQFELTISTQF